MNRRIRNVLAGMMLAAVMTIAAVFPAFAARIAFSDPSVTAGDEFSVTMKITGSNGETISSADVMLSYDSTALEFVSGTGAEGGAGSVRVTGTAENAGNTELAFELRFRSLKAGNQPNYHQHPGSVRSGQPAGDHRPGRQFHGDGGQPVDGFRRRHAV